MAAGVVSALLYGKASEIYNIGSGIGLSNLEIIEKLNLILKKYGVDIFTKHLPERLFDIKVNVLDSTKLKLGTGWMPKISIDIGIEKTVKWHFGNEK